MLAVKSEKSNNRSFFADEMLKVNNRNNPALDRKGSENRQPCRHLMVRAIKSGQSAQSARRQFH